MSRRPVEGDALHRPTRAAWLAAIVLTASAGALIFTARVPAASQGSQGGFYALTASAQALAAVLGLVLATAAVVAQLRALFSRRTLGVGRFREIFGWETIAMVVLYGVVIWLQLAVVSTGKVGLWTVRCLLLASAACLSALAPYLVRLGGRLSPSLSLERVSRRLATSPQGTQLVADIEDFALTAVGQHDYATIRASVKTLRKALESGVDQQSHRSSTAAAEALQTLALVGSQDPLAVSVVVHALRNAAENLCKGDLDAASAATARQICKVISRIADRAVLDQAADDAAACANVLGLLGEELARSGWSAESAIAVGGLFMLKVTCVSERLQDISGIAASHLARIRPGATPELPWPRRAGAPATPNLLLNASFEFGHDFGYGLEPGWHRGPFAQSMWMKAETYHEYERQGQHFVRAIADSRNQSIAQDVRAMAEPGESFIAVCRAASADNTALRGRFALWALGAPGERGEVIYELPPASQAGGSSVSAPAEKSVSWRALRAPLDVRAPGHESLRAEIYIDESVIDDSSQETTEPRGKLLLDDAAIVRANLRNASFELQTLDPWTEESLGGDGECALLRHGSDRTPLEMGGDWYVRMDPQQSPLALRQLTAIGQAGGRTYELSAAIRSASKQPVSVSLEISAGQEQIATATFAAAPSWRMVYLPFSFAVEPGVVDHVPCDVVITVDAGVADVDAVAIVPTLLFDTHLGGHEHWIHSPSTAISNDGEPSPDYGNVASATVGAYDAKAALWQDIPVKPSVGDSYRLAVRGRAASGESAPLTVTIVAKDASGRDLVSSSTRSVLANPHGWTTVSVPFDCQRGDIHVLRALLEIEPGASAKLVGATFNPLVLASDNEKITLRDTPFCSIAWWRKARQSAIGGA